MNGLYTDLYELRMCETYLRLGMTEPATFSLYARPSRARPFILSAGLEQALEVLERFAFGPDDLAYLATQGIGDRTLAWLESARPSGELWAVPDGAVVLANEPLLELTAPLPIAQLLETALLCAVHGPSLVATKAARLVRAAQGRPVVEFGFRRAHGHETGVQAARAAWIGGCRATSNVEAGRRFGIPVSGTMAHSFVLAFDDERTAFREFATDHEKTTLLIDTYDPVHGIEHAIEVARELSPTGFRLAALRIDSEPLLELAHTARRMLDAAGLREVRLVASGGLDEREVDALVRASAPYDAFGIGSSLVCSTDHAALDVSYKLVEYAGRGRAKHSRGKATLPGAKQVFRSGLPASDRLDLRSAEPAGTPLLERVWVDGQRLFPSDLEQARRRASEVLAELPDTWFMPPGPDPVPLPELGAALRTQMEALRPRDGYVR